jgi:predicted nucleic acid-binding protein
MNGKYLLDSNIIIALFAKDPQIRVNSGQPRTPIPEKVEHQFR